MSHQSFNPMHQRRPCANQSIYLNIIITLKLQVGLSVPLMSNVSTVYKQIHFEYIIVQNQPDAVNIEWVVNLIDLVAFSMAQVIINLFQLPRIWFSKNFWIGKELRVEQKLPIFKKLRV